MFVICFFCKQKTADEMRISDWSSDVCSSDLVAAVAGIRGGPGAGRPDRRVLAERGRRPADGGRGRTVGTPAANDRTHSRCRHRHPPPLGRQIGRAACRERVCQYVEISVVAVTLKKKNKVTNTNKGVYT